ncbi:hypothetical protein D3C81_958150 [compost metagenome]
MLIGEFIRLRAKRVNGRAFPGIKHPHLDERFVDITAHFAAQGVNLAHDVAFCRTSNRRIARHKSNHIQIDRNHQRSTSHPRCSQSRLAACMPCANHDHLIVSGSITHVSSTSFTLHPSNSIRNIIP